MAQIGALKWQRAIDTWARCLAADRWPAYVREPVAFYEAKPWERDDEPPPEPQPERAEVAAAREKLQKQAAARKGQPAASSSAAAPAAATTSTATPAPTPAAAGPAPAAFDAAKASDAEIVAYFDGEKVGKAFTAAWNLIKARPGYTEAGHPVYEAFARNRLRLWPNAPGAPQQAMLADAALLRETLAKTDRLAIVQFTLRQKTRLGVLRVHDEPAPDAAKLADRRGAGDVHEHLVIDEAGKAVRDLVSRHRSRVGDRLLHGAPRDQKRGQQQQGRRHSHFRTA